MTVFCSDPTHHVWPSLEKWCRERGAKLVSSREELDGGELLILVSCTHIVPKELRERFEKCVVIHESDLPEGRGWSPLAWQVLEGRSEFTVSLIDCGDPVDSGRIWAKRKFRLEGHELSDEINEKRDRIRLWLMDYAVSNRPETKEQVGKVTYYPRRTPKDSRVDPNKSIAEQFELLRICDPRFPAFFEFRGHEYEISLRKR